MNIYDTKIVACIACQKAIGEIEFDSTMINPLCGYCSSIEDKLHTSKNHQENFRIKIGQAV
ncbi:hypothetical protein [Nitrosarchaeum sp. AC2]|uniref:hypothetical protein n=1 Tax=Nitrosarchaeum sp. AC2 TaxID=2259673 RepID=UPI0015C70307|nr:hypothetical protein [Nitrosarchaeum sp. AC2]QLH10478.1 hypothetical protein DSQ20_02400 [Nitrosarchaeum sp. AC2]